MRGDDEPLVKIGVAHDDVEASIWCDLLEREGIAAYVKASDPMASLGLPPAPGSLEVFVSAPNARRARWILGETPTTT